MLLGITAIVPLTIAVLNAPDILQDPGLGTAPVKRELIWSCYMVGLMVALAACSFLIAMLIVPWRWLTERCLTALAH